MEEKPFFKLIPLDNLRAIPDPLGHHEAGDCEQELKAANAVIAAQVTEIKVKDELITAYAKISAEWETRYNVLQQKNSVEIDAWQKRYQIVYDENERNKKARDRNHKFLAPSAGTALVAGLVLGLLIK